MTVRQYGGLATSAITVVVRWDDVQHREKVEYILTIGKDFAIVSSSLLSLFGFHAIVGTYERGYT